MHFGAPPSDHVSRHGSEQHCHPEHLGAEAGVLCLGCLAYFAVSDGCISSSICICICTKAVLNSHALNMLSHCCRYLNRRPCVALCFSRQRDNVLTLKIAVEKMRNALNVCWTLQAFDSRAFALGGTNSTRFVPRDTADAAAGPPGGRAVSPVSMERFLKDPAAYLAELLCPLWRNDF